MRQIGGKHKGLLIFFWEQDRSLRSVDGILTASWLTGLDTYLIYRDFEPATIMRERT